MASMTGPTDNYILDLLRAARHHLDLHNREYQHVTPADLLADIDGALESGPDTTSTSDVEGRAVLAGARADASLAEWRKRWGK